MIIVLLLLLENFGPSLTHPQNLIQPKIVGGGIAAVGQYPHQISIQMYGQHTCGGSIIDQTTILTAAHCIVNQPSASLYTVVAGINNVGQKGDRYPVAKMVIPGEFVSPLQHDIAILKLAKPIVYNAKVQPIDLETNFVDAGVPCELSGWGQIHANKDISRDLKNVRYTVQSNQACGKAQPHHNPTIYSSHICTVPIQGHGACMGDSGGALTANRRQIGIVSWSRPCAIGYPDVFTRVSYYHNWIQAARA